MINATHLHAMAVHFPIALLILGFLAELTGLIFNKVFFRDSAFFMLLVGAAGTIVSYLAGKAAGEGIEEGTLKIAMELHERAATVALWLTILTALVYLAIYFLNNKKSWLKFAGVVLFAGTMAAIARTGYLGGQLVYKHGAGVELALPDFSNADEK